MNRAEPGDSIDVRLGQPAAGGTCIAHTEGTTWFVSGGLPDELVTAVVTGTRRGGRLGFARVVEVREASTRRVPPPCSLAGICGGCDLLHVAPDYQPVWKASVLRDQLRRLGSIEQIGDQDLAAALPTATPLPVLGWRARFAVDTDAAGQACFHAPRSSELIPVQHCPVVIPELQAAFEQVWPTGMRVRVSDSTTGPTVEPSAAAGGLPAGWRSAATVTRVAGGRSWRVQTGGFWQSHRQAAEILLAAVDQAVRSVEPRRGSSLVDLYSGVGLFAGVLADRRRFERVIAVEGDERAVRLARRNLHDLPAVRLVAADVKDWVRGPDGRSALEAADAIVLDPPRSGAGAAVMTALADSSARVICYVACDGASLARDAKTLLTQGWRFDDLTAFDLYGMSHHLEAVARFVRP